MSRIEDAAIALRRADEDVKLTLSRHNEALQRRDAAQQFLNEIVDKEIRRRNENGITKTKYQVLDNNKLACYPHHDVDESWNNAEFDTIKEAQEYVKKWLFISWNDYLPENIELNKKYKCSAYGDIIEIKEMEYWYDTTEGEKSK